MLRSSGHCRVRAHFGSLRGPSRTPSPFHLVRTATGGAASADDFVFDLPASLAPDLPHPLLESILQEDAALTTRTLVGLRSAGVLLAALVLSSAQADSCICKFGVFQAAAAWATLTTPNRRKPAGPSTSVAVSTTQLGSGHHETLVTKVLPDASGRHTGHTWTLVGGANGTRCTCASSCSSPGTRGNAAAAASLPSVLAHIVRAAAIQRCMAPLLGWSDAVKLGHSGHCGPCSAVLHGTRWVCSAAAVTTCVLAALASLTLLHCTWAAAGGGASGWTSAVLASSPALSARFTVQGSWQLLTMTAVSGLIWAAMRHLVCVISCVE